MKKLNATAPAAPAASNVDLAVLMAELAALKQQVAAPAAPKGKVGRPPKAVGPVADTFSVTDGTRAGYTEIRFSFNGERCKPSKEILAELKLNGYRFSIKDGDARFWGFSKMLPDTFK